MPLKWAFKMCIEFDLQNELLYVSNAVKLREKVRQTETPFALLPCVFMSS